MYQRERGRGRGRGGEGEGEGERERERGREGGREGGMKGRREGEKERERGLGCPVGHRCVYIPGGEPREHCYHLHTDRRSGQCHRNPTACE